MQPKFLTIQDGAYTVNLNLIACIDYDADMAEPFATVTFTTGHEFDFEGEDYTRLMEFVALNS